MRTGSPDDVCRDVRALWGAGAAAALTDAELVRRFNDRRQAGAEAAFAALVARHGPLVLGTCRRMLGDRHDAEDAFQATFLVLARKAGSVRVGDSLGPWLYGVARRVSMEARAVSLRRRHRETTGADLDDVAVAAPGPAGDDLRATIDEEIAGLPERFRTAVVLCDLEGLTIDAAARRLGWPFGTVKSRLARGRERLRTKLTRRGLAPTAGALSAALAHDASGAVPAAALEAAVRAAVSVSGGRATAGAVSAAATSLANGVITAMSLTKFKIAAAAVLLALGAGTGVLAYQGASGSGGDKPGAPAVPQLPRARPQLDLIAVPETKEEAVRKKLDETVALAVPNKTTLETALRAIKAASQGPNDAGLPIYVDPAGLHEAGAAIDRPIEVTLPGGKASLGENLRQLLRPLGLDFRADDGLVTISSRDRTVDETIRRLTEELRKVKGRLERLEKRQREAPEPAKPLET